MRADSTPPATAGPAPTTTASLARAAAENTRGIVAMLLGMASFVTSDSLLKLAGRELPIGEIICVRGVMASLLVLGLGMAMGAFTHPRPHFSGSTGRLMGWRVLAEIGATICFLNGLIRLPFADAAAIGQFVPLAVTAGAAIFLGEPVGWRRWLATIAGLIGVMIIIRPGTAAFDWNALWIIASVGFVAARDLITRRIGSGPPALLLTATSALSVTAMSPAFLLFETWSMPSAATFAYLAGSAFGVLGGYLGVVVAMRSGEISIVSPFRFSVILFALIYGVLVFGERPPPSTLLGVAIVIGAGIYMFHRERVRRAGIARGTTAV